MSLEIKKFIVIPRDAFECLHKRHATEADALEVASDLVSDIGSTHYVLELKAAVCRDVPPVRVKRFE